MKRGRMGRYRLTVWNTNGSRLLVRRLTQREMALVETLLRSLNFPALCGNDLKRINDLPGGAERIIIREDMAGGAS